MKAGQITVIPKLELRAFCWGIPSKNHHLGVTSAKVAIFAQMKCIG